MSDPAPGRTASAAVRRQAAAWVLRCEQGLTPAEREAFDRWLAADPLHGAAYAQHQADWSRFDRLPALLCEGGGEADFERLTRGRRRLRVPLLAAAAALILAAAWLSLRRSAASAERREVLPDGSVVEVNRGASLAVHYAADERRVTLERGEAQFIVAHDRARPFVVSARGIDVRAVGTAFNVRMDAGSVAVLVVEGRVQVKAASAAGIPSAPPLVPLLEARQQAVFSLAPRAPPPQITTLTSEQIGRALAWQHRRVDFTSARLADIVAEFNRWNSVKLVIADPDLASVRVSASLHTYDAEGFLRLLDLGFGVRAERSGDSEILLRKSR